MRVRTTLRKIAPVAILVVPLLVGGCIQGEGPVTTETRTLRPFSHLEVGSGIQVMLTIGPAGPALVRAQGNVLPAVATGVSGETLSIEATNDFIAGEPVLVTISTPTLAGVSMSGGAQLAIDGLDGEMLELRLMGGSRARASGTAGSIVLTADGGSSAELDALEAGSVEVTIAGGSTATVNASGSIKGSASGGARLTIAGDATVDVTSSGGATIERAGTS